MDMYGGKVALDPHLKNGGLRATFVKSRFPLRIPLPPPAHLAHLEG